MSHCVRIIQHSRIGMMLYFSTALSCVSNYIPSPYSHITSRTTDTNKGTADSAMLGLISVSTVRSVDSFDRGFAVLAVYIRRCCVTCFQRYACLRVSPTTTWVISISINNIYPFTHTSQERLSWKTHVRVYRYHETMSLSFYYLLPFPFLLLVVLLNLFLFLFLFLSSSSVCWKGINMITASRKRGVSINIEQNEELSRLFNAVWYSQRIDGEEQ